MATIDGGFAFVNNIENLNFIAGCFFVEVGFLGHGGLGVWFLGGWVGCPGRLGIAGCFLVGVGFLGHGAWGCGSWVAGSAVPGSWA